MVQNSNLLNFLTLKNLKGKILFLERMISGTKDLKKNRWREPVF